MMDDNKFKIKKSVKKRQVFPSDLVNTQSAYCICRKPDNGRWMIGCDFCDDWFHGDCVNMNEDKARLVVKYSCPRCSPNTPGTWKRKCRLKACLNPVGEMSKYCCHEHGVQFIRELIKEGVAGVTKSQLARLVQVDSADKFKKLGNSNPIEFKLEDNSKNDQNENPQGRISKTVMSPAVVDNSIFNEDGVVEILLNQLDSLEHERVLKARKDRTRIFKERDRLTKKSKYLKQAKDHIKQLNGELATELGVKKKDICGLDSDLMSEQWQRSEGQFQDRSKLCLNDRKKCLKHTNWHGLMVAEVELELNNLSQQQTKLLNELKDRLEFHRQREATGI